MNIKKKREKANRRDFAKAKAKLVKIKSTVLPISSVYLIISILGAIIKTGDQCEFRIFGKQFNSKSTEKYDWMTKGYLPSAESHEVSHVDSKLHSCLKLKLLSHPCSDTWSFVGP